MPLFEETISVSSNCAGLFDHEYWKCAWVTQEVLLAKHVEVLIAAEAIALPKLVNVHAYSSVNWAKTPMVQLAVKGHKMKGRSLVHLLAHFRGKQCSVPRDRIFSLLSLCNEHGKNLSVDYDLPDEKLMYEVFRHSGGAICWCSAAIVVHSLQVTVSLSAPALRPNNRLQRNSKGYEGAYVDIDITEEEIKLMEPMTPSRKGGKWKVLLGDCKPATVKYAECHFQDGVRFQPRACSSSISPSASSSTEIRHGESKGVSELVPCSESQTFLLYWRERELGMEPAPAEVDGISTLREGLPCPSPRRESGSPSPASSPLQSSSHLRAPTPPLVPSSPLSQPQTLSKSFGRIWVQRLVPEKQWPHNIARDGAPELVCGYGDGLEVISEEGGRKGKRVRIKLEVDGSEC